MSEKIDWDMLGKLAKNIASKELTVNLKGDQLFSGLFEKRPFVPKQAPSKTPFGKKPSISDFTQTIMQKSQPAITPFVPKQTQTSASTLAQTLSQKSTGSGEKLTKMFESKKSQKGVKELGKTVKGFKGGLSAFSVFGAVLKRLGIAQPFIEIFNGWIDLIGSSFTPIIEKLVPLFNRITPYVQMFSEGLRNLIDKLTSVEGWKDIGKKLKDGIVAGWGNVKDWVKNKIITPFQNGWSAITEWFNSKIIDPIKNGWKSIATWFTSNVIDPIKRGWKSIVNWFNQYIIDPIRNAWKSLLNGIIGFINTIIEGVNFLIPGTKWDIQLLSVSV